MTIDNRLALRDLLAQDAIGNPEHEPVLPTVLDDTDVVLLPEQELCTDCTLDDDLVTEPGIAQDVVDRSIEPMTLSSDWDPEWGSGPLYEVTWLACGHTIARLA